MKNLGGEISLNTEKDIELYH